MEKKVGWTGGLHLSVGEKCVERLTKLLWYIDPHLKKFANCGCHLPNLFIELSTYKQKQCYNQYYSVTHHKHEDIAYEKLNKLASSLDLSLAQPWTQDILWNLLIEDLYKLIEIVKKYMTYLKKVNNSMNELHKSLEPARDGIENIIVKVIEACDQLETSIYNDLNNAILDLSDYEYINIEQYFPKPGMERHCFIKDLELILPIGFYQHHAGVRGKSDVVR